MIIYSTRRSRKVGDSVNEKTKKDDGPRYLKVKQELIAEIKKLQTHQRIASRPELQKKYQVTRTTIDRAISELIGEGYLYSKDKSGTYVSNSGSGSALKSGKMIHWGMLVPNVMHHYYSGMLRGVEDVANENGINVVICNTDNNAKKQEQYLNKLIDSEIKGIAIVPAVFGDEERRPFELLREQGIPFVFCNRGVNGVAAPRVINNSGYGAYLLTKHLIQNGYRRIAYLSRPLSSVLYSSVNYSAVLERYQGYYWALSEAGIELNEDYVLFEEHYHMERLGYESTQKLLGKDPRPDAIFCYNDNTALGALDAIQEAGLKVGEDIGLAGFEGVIPNEKFTVKLTSVKLNTYEIGQKAARTLLKMTQGQAIAAEKVEFVLPELLVGESSQGLKRL
jgi:DNA-binding LacI/PurR family transcriptional regulator